MKMFQSFLSLSLFLGFGTQAVNAGNSSSGGGGAFVDGVGSRLWSVYDQIEGLAHDKENSEKLLNFLTSQKPDKQWSVDAFLLHLEETIRDLEIRFEDRRKVYVDLNTGRSEQPFELMEGFAGRNKNGVPFFVSYVELQSEHEKILNDICSRSDLFYGHELMRAAGFSELEGNSYYISRRLLRLSASKFTECAK